MKHFPVFLQVTTRRIILSGGGETALAKLRLLLKTEAHIEVFSPEPSPVLYEWEAAGKITLTRRALCAEDCRGAALFYAANENDTENQRVAALARSEGVLVNIVDNLHESDFITPAIVDRDPVVVAIGTEGTSPVLARIIKAELETFLSPSTGILARIAGGFRDRVMALASGRHRRAFWVRFFKERGPRAFSFGSVAAVKETLRDMLAQDLSGSDTQGWVDFVGAGPGDPELLTLKARKALNDADVILYDRLVPASILELARREAELIYVGKVGFGPSTPQQKIHDLMVARAKQGLHVVRLKAGDPAIFGRLEEELSTCEKAGLEWHIVPGVTAASAGAAAIGTPLTARQRNSQLIFLTSHDVQGFTEHQWASLASSGQVAAIYMGRKAARFFQGRMLMHGAAAQTPVTLAFQISQPNQHIQLTTLGNLEKSIKEAKQNGPLTIFYGIAPRHAAAYILETEKRGFA